MRTPWTVANDEYLLKNRDEMSAKELGDALGRMEPYVVRSPNAVRNRLYYMRHGRDGELERCKARRLAARLTHDRRLHGERISYPAPGVMQHRLMG